MSTFRTRKEIANYSLNEIIALAIVDKMMVGMISEYEVRSIGALIWTMSDFVTKEISELAAKAAENDGFIYHCCTIDWEKQGYDSNNGTRLYSFTEKGLKALKEVKAVNGPRFMDEYLRVMEKEARKMREKEAAENKGVFVPLERVSELMQSAFYEGAGIGAGQWSRSKSYKTLKALG